MKKTYTIHQNGIFRGNIYTEELSNGDLGIFFDKHEIVPETTATEHQFNRWRRSNSENYVVAELKHIKPIKTLKQHIL
jgi:hypothetical protein